LNSETKPASGSTKHWEDSPYFRDDATEKPPAPPVEVPPSAISDDALSALIESFILREGTDYGLAEASHSTKIGQVRKQIQKEQVKIVFDPESETVTLVTIQDWLKMQKPQA
jgi:uncharacterized protein YheU (UPF0270 family)